MNNIFFVILHYQNIEDTINCIKSIDKLNKNENTMINIVLVDNCSPNSSGKELEKIYMDRKDIKCILLDKNYGFSKANNIGYEFARSNAADIVLVINNDILIEDNEFLNKLINNKSNFDIISPDIVNLKNNHQNPLKKVPYSLTKALKNMIFEYFQFIIMYIPIVRDIFINVNSKREKKWFEMYYSDVKNNIDINDFVPFGAFIIYTNDWLKNENRAFVSDTFMYLEEDMLSLYIKKKKYKILYDYSLKVKHLEGQSTKKSNKNIYKIIKFKSKNKANSLRKYIKFYIKIKKEK